MALIKSCLASGRNGQPYAKGYKNETWADLPIVDNVITISDTYNRVVVSNINSISGSLSTTGTFAKLIYYIDDVNETVTSDAWGAGSKSISGTCTTFLMSSSAGGTVESGSLTIS